ncbi:MAG: hypothetical protein EOO13_02520 [Chitinophagaceae bacterium]|nr:MAG: hypothetical protein EOO13_02520 [Chitinophagaceae bacterium]
MADNIVTRVMEKFDIDSFIKINPNTQKEERQGAETGANSQQFEQALVTSVLAGLYKYGSTDEGSRHILAPANGPHLLDEFFVDHKAAVTNGLAAYGNIAPIQVNELMEKIAAVSVDAVKESVGTDAKPEAVRSYIAGQRHNILVYLPPDLHFGKLIGDDILDDRTNKMEGPVSSLMHFIENLFSQKDTDKASN